MTLFSGPTVPKRSSFLQRIAEIREQEDREAKLRAETSGRKHCLDCNKPLRMSINYNTRERCTDCELKLRQLENEP